MNNKCIFCDIKERKLKAQIIYEDEDVLAFRDINPLSPLHVLIIPKKHLSSLNEISDNDASLIGKLFLLARDIAQKEGVANQGYRLVLNVGEQAGQSVFHLHLHLLGGRYFGWPPG